MDKVGGTRHERLIIAVIVLCAIVELIAWLFPRPYRWASDERMDTALVEVEGRRYVMFDSGEVLRVSDTATVESVLE